MAFKIKSLAAATVVSGTPLQYDPDDSGAESAIIKSIRMVNTGSQDATVNVTYDSVRILPQDLKIPPKAMVCDGEELTVTAGKMLQVSVNSGDSVACVISGMERE
jgi:hypothetical protein